MFLWRAPQAPAERMRTPYLVFFHIGPNTWPTHTGPLGVLDREYQISLFDPQQTRVLGIADALRLYLDGKQGLYQTVRFSMIQYRTQTSAYELDTRLFHVIQEYRMQLRLPEGFTTATVPRGDLPPLTTNQTNQE